MRYDRENNEIAVRSTKLASQSDETADVHQEWANCPRVMPHCEKSFGRPAKFASNPKAGRSAQAGTAIANPQNGQ
jgi:hypothetical protein